MLGTIIKCTLITLAIVDIVTTLALCRIAGEADKVRISKKYDKE